MADPSIWSRLWLLRGTTLSKSQQFAIGVMVFGALIAIALPLASMAKYSAMSSLMEVEAKITAIEERCDLSAKATSGFSAGQFEFVRTTSCKEADVFVASNESSEWKAERRTDVTVEYVASGLTQNVVLEASRLDVNALVVGGTVPLYVNPNKLDDAQTGNTTRNILLTAIVSVVAAGFAALGWFLFKWLTPELDGSDDDDQPSSMA